jgi:hypothetical protein
LGVALDDDAQIDPATLPENVEVMQGLDAQIAEANAKREHQRALEARLSSAIADAASRIQERVIARGASDAREEDLRGGIADELRARGELVLTEAKLRVPGWTTNLGGFDLAIVVDNSVGLGETKWADGNLYECMWDLFKLGSALSLDRVDAGVAVYGAPAKHWQQAEGCARLFEDREVLTREPDLGASARLADQPRPKYREAARHPMLLRVQVPAATTCQVLGKTWEIRAVGVTPNGGDFPLADGWPKGGRPETPKPYTW